MLPLPDPRPKSSRLTTVLMSFRPGMSSSTQQMLLRVA
jgi:hypothetical protein